MNEINPISLSKVDDEELLNLHRRCHQLYTLTKEGKLKEFNAEDIFNAHTFIVEEMEKRGFQHNPHDELDGVLERLAKKNTSPLDFEKLPSEILVVNNFVNLVGSSVKSDNYDDVDVLIRADLNEDKTYYNIKNENISLPLRKALTPEDKEKLHIILNPQGAHDDFIPLYDLVLRKKKELKVMKLDAIRFRMGKALNTFKDRILKKSDVEPIMKNVTLPKPSMKIYGMSTEAFTVDELKPWLDEHLANGVVVEQKYNGFRTLIQKDKTGNVSVFFEDSQKDKSKQLPELVEEIEKIPDAFIVDCDVGLEHANGERLPRIDVMKLLGKNPILPQGIRVKCTLFDMVYWNKDISDKEFIERRDELHKFYKKYLSKSQYFAVADGITAKTIEDIQKAWRKFSKIKYSEGIVLKDATGKYEFKASADWMAKVKVIVELKVKVLRKKILKNQARQYLGGVINDSENINQTQIYEEDGVEYVALGWTYNTDIDAQLGDIITVQPQEILFDATGNDTKVKWQSAMVIDVDKSRKEPYHLSQVIDLSERANALQVKMLEKLRMVRGLKKPLRPFKRIVFCNGTIPENKPPENEIIFALDNPYYNLFTSLQKYGEETVDKLPDSMIGNRKMYNFLKSFNPREASLEVEKNLYLLLFDGINTIPRYFEDKKVDVAKDTIRKIAKMVRNSKIIKVDDIQDYDSEDTMIISQQDLERHFSSATIAQISDMTPLLRRKEEDDEEGGTRGEAARKFWESNWYKCFPVSGKGRFVYQHHWRGLTEEESKKDEEYLLKTNNSLHGDLRFEFKNSGVHALFGITVFLGKASENASDRLINESPNENLECAFKLMQPPAWLDVGSPAYVSSPGGVGSTSQGYAKFFKVDSGTYEIGVWRKHFFEFFLKGKKLKGRYIATYAPVGGRRRWLIKKPEDQTPYAEKNKLEDVVMELKKKGQDYLLWSKPGEKPKLIDVQKEAEKIQRSRDDLKFGTKIVAVKEDDDGDLFVLAPFLVPFEKDYKGKWIKPQTIERAVHDFVRDYLNLGLQHEFQLPKEAGEIVECGIYRNLDLPEGSAFVGIKVKDPQLKEMIRKKDIKGVSFGGYGVTGEQIMRRKTDEELDEVNEIKDLKIMEISLVDNPGVPAAEFLIVRRKEDGGDNMAEENSKIEEAKDEKVSDVIQDVIDKLRDAAKSDEVDKDAIEKLAKTLEQVMEIVKDLEKGYGYPEEEYPEPQREEKSLRDDVKEILSEILESEEFKRLLDRDPEGEAEKIEEKQEESETEAEEVEEKAEDEIGEKVEEVKEEKEEKPSLEESVKTILDDQLSAFKDEIAKEISQIERRYEKISEKLGIQESKSIKGQKIERTKPPTDFYSRLGRDEFGYKK